MILTVTPNAALDRLIFIDEFRPGTRMRCDKVIHSVGGKGLDSSVALRTFEVDTVALSFVAGAAGRQLVHLLEGYGVRPDMVWVEGETRVVHVLAETRRHRHSHLITGTLPITAEAAADLLARYQAHLAEAVWVIGGGTLAPGWPTSFYHHIIELAHAARVPILVDSSGPPVINALPSRPDILKMNRTEFAETFNISADTLAGLRRQGQALREREKLPALVITCGDEGILALTPAGDYLAASPVQPAVNAAGAGDTASAMLAWRFSVGDNWVEALRWAAAAGAASVLTEGTADSRREDVERILPQVIVTGSR